MRAINWQRTVAMAAPLIPISSTNMKIGSIMVFETTVKTVSPIANFGFPEARTMLFNPK